MYQGKSIKSINDSVYNRVKQRLVNNGIDMGNRPNPYAMIKKEEEENRKKKAGNVPFQWMHRPRESQNNQFPIQDPNVSVTVSRAEISQQGFAREFNQSFNQSTYHTQNQSFHQTSNFTKNQQKTPPGQSTLSSFFRPNTNTTANHGSYNNNFAAQNSNIQRSFTNNSSFESNNNSMNNNHSRRNLMNIEQLFDEDSAQNHQDDYDETDFNPPQIHTQNDKFQQTKQERIKPREIFKKGEKKQQRKSADIQKLCGLMQCDPNSKLTTLKILEPVGPTVRNYEIGDINMWELNNKYADYILRKALVNFPHIKDFKNNQKAVIKCALNDNDVFVCIPTGGGKSLIFQIMTFIKKGIYLCILPLISLMYDQEVQAQNFNIEAYSLTGATNITKTRQIYSKISSYTSDKNSLLIFCTPQKISLNQNFIQLLTGVYNKGYLQHVIIDEVHCVSTWGRDFRKEYQNLSQVKVFFPKTPILGLTATVTETVKQEIIKKLKLKKCYFFQSSFNRPNLMYEVRQKTKRSAIQEICQILKQHQNESGIIYCISKKECEEICQKLNAKSYRTAFYHADLHDDDRRQIQQMWMENKIKIIIATIAFGMGINKPDVRFVIHNSLSKSLQNYYQQSGRAGRDGKPAKCILFYQRGDRTAYQTMNLRNQYSSVESKMFSNRQLSQMVKYCEEKFLCRRQFQLNYLGEKDFNPEMCQKTCDNCIKGKKFKQFQCIVHAKEIVRFLKFVSDKRDRITRAQMISIFKSKKGNKNNKTISYPYLPKIQQLFRYWTNDHLQEILLELLSEEVLRQNVVTTNFKKIGNVSNVYIECNFAKSHKFLEKVETLPMRREIKSSYQSNTPSSKNYNEQFFNELLSEEQEKSQPKQDYIEFQDCNSYDPYDQINFGESSEMGFTEFEYNEHHAGKDNQIKQQKCITQNRVKIQEQKGTEDQKRAKIMDFIEDLFGDQDFDI